MKSHTPYMHTTAKEEVEEKRLLGLNTLHNPHTLKFLLPLLSGRKKILEVGCGSERLAAEVLSVIDKKAEFTAVDRDSGQVEHSKRSLSPFPNARVIKLDVATEWEKLKKEGPFDLIYCRWLLVHLPSSIRMETIKNLLGLLSESGVFLCDECDNRSVRFKPIQFSSIVSAPYEEATKSWLTISKGLMQLLGNDLEYTPEKIGKDLVAASAGKGEVKIEGQYQVVLRGKDQKRLLTDGYRSSSRVVSQVCSKSFEEIILPFDKCVEDESIEVEFLTENVVTYSMH